MKGMWQGRSGNVEREGNYKLELGCENERRGGELAIWRFSGRNLEGIAANAEPPRTNTLSVCAVLWPCLFKEGSLSAMFFV
ncbi:UNVERIFIED_CONTAM: hypothetical protein Sradi_2459200 [Sesamum radiatum]|uniref:Uncharacterized protein n=1 Tax=Sesamum radiatum TaxID=300843 RepID=A0AAW2SIR2_SESRA